MSLTTENRTCCKCGLTQDKGLFKFKSYKCKSCESQYQKEYRIKNKDKRSSYDKVYKEYNKEKIQSYLKNWNKNNKYKKKGYIETYKTRHPEKFQEIMKQSKKKYLTNFPGRFKQASTRVISSGNIWKLSFEEWKNLIEPNQCHYCFGQLDKNGSGLDQMIPSGGYIINNVVPCCGKCNKIKGDNLTYDEMSVAMNAVLEYRIKCQI